MSQSTDPFTRWSVVAAGQGGGRIASQFFERSENPGIDERILVINTNRSDIRNTIRRIQDEMQLESVEDVWDQYALEFGSEGGAGNQFAKGEQLARESFDRIMNDGLVRSRFAGTDAIMHMATLGGGTGNGSIPYIIQRFKSDISQKFEQSWLPNVTHTSFAVWPYYSEPPQRHFNAVCGLSRLLRQSDGQQNADMVLLAANSHLDDDENRNDYARVNERIITAVDMMLGAGRDTQGVIDVQDYVSIPSQLGAYHFTPAVKVGANADMFELDYIFEQAAKNAFVPLDVGTARVTFAIVRAPESMIHAGDITEPDVNNALDAWQDSHGISAPGMTSLTPKREPGSDVDVLMLLGGFDLGPLLDHSWDQYESHKQNVQRARSLGNSILSQSELQRIEDNLLEYRELNEE
ncbi:MAG: hypothetical protein ABEJ22_01695 [Haloferacaceae archaeon]